MNLPLHFLTEAPPFNAQKIVLVPLVSAGAVALAGKIEDDDALAPLNAISHIVWGDEAFEQRDFSLRYTGTALLLNGVSVASWALLHEWLISRHRNRRRSRNRAQSNLAPFAGGALVSLVAYLADYHLVPERLKPGFERHLQPKSLLFIYVLLALALGASNLWKRKQ